MLLNVNSGCLRLEPRGFKSQGELMTAARGPSSFGRKFYTLSQTEMEEGVAFSSKGSGEKD